MFIGNPIYDRDFTLAAIAAATDSGNNALLPTVSPGFWTATAFDLTAPQTNPLFSE
jgi:hypothetical protein